MRDHTGLIRSLVADSALGPLRGLLLTLTVVTGVVDAVSILALGRVFVANMTGNVVFAAFALVGAPGFSLSASLFALAGFLVGAYGGGVLIGRFGHDRGLLLRAGGAVELAFAAVALVVAATSGDQGVTHGTIGLAGGVFGAAVTDAIAALLATALGVQNAVARKLAVPDLTTTVLTMTLTGVGADIRAIFGDRPRTKARGAARSALGRRLLAVAAMVIGAVAGASLALRVSPLSGLALATALLTVVTAWIALATRRPAGWRAFPAAQH
ncbi:MAG TPA: YoaK family protein [Trebonia sp.]|nr:YoaK family protein [Trebonia sp.]